MTCQLSKRVMDTNEWLQIHNPHGGSTLLENEKQPPPGSGYTLWTYECPCGAKHMITKDEDENMDEKPKTIDDQPLGNGPRRTAVQAHFRRSVTETLAEVFAVMQPTDVEATGLKYSDQMALAAVLFAQEYQAVTGYPILDVLVKKGVVLKPDPNHPGVPDVAAPAAGETDGAREELGALKFEDD